MPNIFAYDLGYFYLSLSRFNDSKDFQIKLNFKLDYLISIIPNDYELKRIYFD